VLTYGGSCLDYEYDAAHGDRVPGPTAPVVAIPTTSGTGSEVTLWAIVTDTSRNYKAPIGSLHLAPRVALVDPLLTISLPPSVTAGTGVDALVHAIEAFTARCSNPISDALCLYAIELVSLHLVRAFDDGSDLEARSGMMLASLIAGMGFGNSDTAAVHSMGEALGGLKDVPHGMAMAICLPHVLRLNAQAVPEKIARLGESMGLSKPATAEAVINHIEGLLNRLRIPALADYGVAEADVPALVRIALLNSGNPDNPVDVDAEVFARLYREALGG
jgi:alcohol dehydrogenase